MIEFVNGLKGSEKVADLCKSFRNHDLLFRMGNDLVGKLCTGNGGHRLELFDNKKWLSHICGCPLERNMDWLGYSKEGKIEPGAVYGHTDVPSMTLAELVEYMVSKWLEEINSQMHNLKFKQEHLTELQKALKADPIIA